MLDVLQQLMQTNELREAFATADGPQALHALLGVQLQSEAVDWDVARSVGALAEAASAKDEDNKCK